MTPERHRELSTTEALLTTEEIKFGWHFCPDWDYALCLLDYEGCTCKKEGSSKC